MCNFRVGVTKGDVIPQEDFEFVLPPEVVTEIGPETPLEQRLAALKGLKPAVRSRRLQEHGVELLWFKIHDLAEGQDDIARREAWDFFEAVIRGQFTQLDIMRAQFFRLLKNHHFSGYEKARGLNNIEVIVDKDLEIRLRLLDALTEHGKDILHFEDEIGVFMQKLLPEVLADDHEQSIPAYLGILNNLIKFNSAFIDPEVICSLVTGFSRICAKGKSEDVQSCLTCLDSIICYNYIPKEGLSAVIYLLCRVVNLEQHSLEAWKIARHLLGTHLGHSALYSLCQMLQSSDFKHDVAVIRGAVFYIGLSLWGNQRVKTLETYSPMTILPTFESALECQHHLVIYEVVLQTERFVTKTPSSKLRALGSDAVVRLLEDAIQLVPDHVPAKFQAEILSHVHNVISVLEVLAKENKYLGSKHKLYDLIELCAEKRPEESVVEMLSYRANDIYTTKPGWMNALGDLMDKYYAKEQRAAVRIKALNVLLQIFKSNRQMHEEEILKRLILPHLSNLDVEPQISVRLEAIRVLTAVCLESTSKRCIELLEVLERITKRPLLLKKEAFDQGKTVEWAENSFDDITTAVIGLIQIFCTKLCQQPISVVIKAYSILVHHLDNTYNNLDVFSHVGHIRKSIFQLFMQLRANEQYHIGVECEKGAHVHYSPYLLCR